MATATLIGAVSDAPTRVPEPDIEARWYALYTCAHHERRVAKQLALRSVEHLLPLYETVRRWKDRRVRLELPLFPSYLFVRTRLRERLRILEIPSAVRLVGFDGHPVPLPEEEIEALRSGLERQVRAEPHPYLKIGRRVRIIGGPLRGVEGILLRKKHSLRVVLSIDLIMRSIAVEVDLSDVEPVR